MSFTFGSFLDELTATARNSDDVVGLVAFGSTAARERSDEWSDHDFAWLVAPGAADRYRDDLSWLPAAHDIALAVVEHHGGVKVIYNSGHRLEFGIADVESFATWAGAPAEVLVGEEAVFAATAQVVARRPEGEVNALREVQLMLTQVHSGVSRARRGEVLSASGLVRFEAVNHLARAVSARLHSDSRLDPLDPRRRFDAVAPDLGAALESTTRLPIEPAARELLLIAERHLATGWPEFPAEGFRVVRARFGWD